MRIASPEQTPPHTIAGGAVEETIEDDAVVQHGRPASQRSIVIVHPSRLFRDCLRQAFETAGYSRIRDFAEPEQAEEAFRCEDLSLLLLGLTSTGLDSTRRLDLVIEQLGQGVPVVVTSESEDPKFVAELFSKGIKGYVPSSLELGLTIKALELVVAGGTYVAGDYLVRLWQKSLNARGRKFDSEALTTRELLVVEALRVGKSNKSIAYELNMCESTVKVHVRNIMKKLSARNRTQAVYIANERFNKGVSD